MKKIYQTIFFLLATSTVLQAQVTVFTPGAFIDMAVDGNYLYYVDANGYVVLRADITTPGGLITLLPITDTDDNDYDSNAGVGAIGVNGDNLYVGTIGSGTSEFGYFYQKDLTNLALDVVKVSTEYAQLPTDLDFSGDVMYVGDFNYGVEELRAFDVSDPLPVSSSSYIDRSVTALTIDGYVMYLAKIDPVSYDSEIFVKNMLSPSPETSLLLVSGTVRDILMVDNLLYFTDSDGVKRFDPSVLPATPELIVANADYGMITKIQHKLYGIGESYLFALDHSGQRVLKVDLNAIVTSIANEHQVHTGMYPNPAQNELTVTSNSPLKSLTIYDILGKPVKSIQLSGATNTSRIDIAVLASGMYVLEMETSENTTVSRFMKN